MTGHIRVRTVSVEGGMSVFCENCGSAATIVMPINADDFCSILEAFLHNHEDCEKEES